MEETPHPNATTAAVNGGEVPSSETLSSKRQRRPSVRLWDIVGDYRLLLHETTNPRRGNGQWKTRPHFQSSHLSNLDYNRSDGISKGSSRTRPITKLTNLVEREEEKEGGSDTEAIGSWKRRDFLPPPVKRVRSNWVAREAKLEDGGGGNGGELEREGNVEEMGEEDGFSERENSGSKEENGNSPVTCVKNLDKELNGEGRKVGSFNRNGKKSLDLDGGEHSGRTDNDVRCVGGGGGGDDGVRIWLNGNGLGRYASVFKVHEVDDEVLPMLTLEDLKDMGIDAVGSRRKMFCAIQKLGRGFS